MGSNSTIKHLPATEDDPKQRKPDITVAKVFLYYYYYEFFSIISRNLILFTPIQRELGWSPVVPVKEGLRRTVEYFRKELEDTGEVIPTGPGASKPKPTYQKRDE